MKRDLLRVALIGPESSGKTTSCIELAKHFKTVWVPEYARDYLGKLNRRYNFEDVIHCAEMQLKLEKQYEEKASKILFYDTEFINFKVWFLDVYKACPDWIEKKIAENKYDLFLLTKPDLPFVDDPLRENPHRRQYFFDWYKTELDKRKFKYEVIEGVGKDRLSMALKIVKKNLKKL